MMKSLKKIGLISLLGLALSTSAATAAPSLKILWDISKGYDYREQPLGFYDEDGYAAVLLILASEMRGMYPEDRSNLPDYALIATSPAELAAQEEQGLFPDILLSTPEWPTEPKAYITLSRRGITELDKYDVLVVPTNTALILPYTAAEAAAIFAWVQRGGLLLLAGDNFWVPRANLMPIMRLFGLSYTMSLVSDTTVFAQDLGRNLFRDVNTLHTRAGAGLCIGTAPGWDLTYDQYREVLQFGNGVYQRRLDEYTQRYANMSAEEACNERRPPAGVSVRYIGLMERTHEGAAEKIPVIAEATAGLGKALIFSDVSWFDNGMMQFAEGTGRDNVRFVRNLTRWFGANKRP